MKSPYKKIRIIGTCGSGKSFLAKNLSKKLKIPHYDLDDIFFKIRHSVRRKDQDIKKLIKNVLKKKSWIIEGLQYYNHNLEKTFENADLLIWVNPHIGKVTYRLIKRFFTRILSRNEKIKDNFKLLKTALKYKLRLDTKTRKNHEDIIKKYSSKTIILKSNKQINNFLKNIK